MDAAQRQLSDQIDQATQRLLDTARVITEPDLRAPSLLPGWTRAHVLAHLARGADAMRNLLVGVRSGQERPAYVSAEARQADIEHGAGMQAKELMADLADSAMALRTIARQLPDEGWQVPVRILDSAPLPGRSAADPAAGRGGAASLRPRRRVRPGRLAGRLRRPGTRRADAIPAPGPAQLPAVPGGEAQVTGPAARALES